MVLESLSADIYKVLEGRTLFDPAIIDRFGDRITDILHRRLKQEDREPTLRMSNIGTECLRRLWYDLHGVQGEEIQGKGLLKFLYGDLVESIAIALAEVAGYKVERFQEEVNVDGVLGHIDLVLSGILVDVKSCSGYTFEKFKSGKLLEPGEDAFSYCQQLAGYAHVINLPAAWVAINKVDGDIAVLELPKEKINEYDIQRRVQTVREAINRDAPPERHYADVPEGKSGNMRLDVQCSYCPQKFNCWGDSNDGTGLRTFYYSKGPVFLTSVKKQPIVFERKT